MLNWGAMYIKYMIIRGFFQNKDQGTAFFLCIVDMMICGVLYLKCCCFLQLLSVVSVLGVENARFWRVFALVLT